MTNEEALKRVKGYLTNCLPADCYEEVEEIIKALEQEPCEDCISRQAVNEGFKKYDRSSFAYGCVWGYVNKLPSVTPKEKTGWIPVSERLPEEFQRVLVTIVNYKGDKIVRVAEYYSRNNGKGVFQIKENHEKWEVGEKGLLAWMPLPKPYEPQESEVSE